jgi:hypothetical protein
MSVDASHPSCFVLERRLFAIPSGATRSVAQTRSDLRAHGGWPVPARSRLDVGLIVGAVTGGFFLAFVAAGVWGVDSLSSLLLCFAMGAIVGGLLAAGTRALFIAPVTASPGAPTSEAVEIPWDVADAAPIDATGDELILWATLVVRYRMAEEARGRRADVDGDPHPDDTSYEAVLRDYESVASLLGLAPGAR